MNTAFVANFRDSLNGSFQVLSVREVKEYANIAFEGEDQLIESLIYTAEEYFEEYTGHFLRDQVRTVRYLRRDEVSWRVPAYPVQGLNAVRKRDQDTTTDLGTDDFYALSENHPPEVHATDRGVITPPATHIELDLQVGYGAEEDVPEKIKTTLMKMVTDLYEFRVSQGEEEEEDTEAGSVPLTWQKLIAPHKVMFLT